ncbi:uncharacterized protein Z519_04620 [Cladophialophora bantiana CBS 173.52]|uniref:Uncharacterized protein n=1 Tax=Cladophialophora bantiana (strain ATCC 10958 / CBS 173.52 / CDC B-1940 / NIH 8579) TaxID=1442370 RepID=A0A0D2ID09_CLAB1|nr:uncharacterized protein Z519_04620 [Cladophialophora bantiana CBS 173.52]KIW94644.1 hypothetical protein Z519_04620 [Cladophialophora bantiana CBS 173.52]
MGPDALAVESHQLGGTIKEIAIFLNNQRPGTFRTRKLKGGWEGWLQVELDSALDTALGMNYKVSSEQTIFNGSNQMVDIGAEPLAGPGATLPCAGIELKVESAYQTGSQRTLPRRLQADIEMCIKGP